jgi:hypothetical protein
MALLAAGRNVVGAGFTLIGITVWAVAAIGPTTAHASIAFLGVTLGGGLAMAGLALSLAPARRVRRRYFHEDGQYR